MAAEEAQQFTRTSSDVGTKEKLQVLLAEYSSLRAEILQRNTVMNQFLTTSITASVAIVGLTILHQSVIVGLLIGCLLVLVIFFVATVISFDTRKAAQHVQKLETRINALAGDKLLEWETENGILRVGVSARFKWSV